MKRLDKKIQKAILAMYPLLIGRGINLSCDIEAVEDAVQDVMEQIWKTRHRLTDVANLEAYATNILYARLSRHTRRSIKTQSIDNCDPEYFAYNCHFGDWADVQYSEMIATLDKNELQIFELRYKNNWTNEKIALLLNMSESNVRKKLKTITEKVHNEILKITKYYE